MGPLSFMRPVVDRNVIMRRIAVLRLYGAGPKYSGHTAEEMSCSASGREQL